MKIKTCLILLTELLFALQIYSQSIEIGANYTSSNAIFLKNTPGINIGYVQHFKNQFLFAEIKTSLKNNSYSEITTRMSSGDMYYIQKVDGRLIANTLKLGIAQKLLNSEKVCISFGGYASLNYFKINEEIEYLTFSTTSAGNIFFETKDELLKNKFGFGCLIDIEIKQFLLDNLSLFSRMDVSHTKFQPLVRGLSFTTFDFNSLGFASGFRVYI